MDLEGVSEWCRRGCRNGFDPAVVGGLPELVGHLPCWGLLPELANRVLMVELGRYTADFNKCV